MPVGDLIEVKVYSSFQDQVGINVRHWVIGAVVGIEPPAASLVSLLDTGNEAAYKACLATQATYEGLSWQKLSPGPIGPVAYSVNKRGQGTVLGEPLPRQISGLIRFTTAYGGRSGRGRMYIPFPGEADNLNGIEPTPDYLTRIAEVGVYWGASKQLLEAGLQNGVTINPVLWNRTTGVATIITGSSPRPGWATQRRRGTFGTPNVFNPVS